jgi:PAS domain S-box-containing protein
VAIPPDDKFAGGDELASGLLAVMQDGAVVFDAAFDVVAVNRAFTRITGREASDLLGPSGDTPFWTSGAGTVMRIVLDAMRSGDYGEKETSFLHANGDAIAAILSPACLKDGQGQPLRYIVTVKDITTRKRHEAELEKSRARFQLVMDTIPQRVFWKDKNFVYMGCNRVFAEDAGLTSPEEIIGMDDFHLSWVESAPLYRADDQDVMENDLSKINYEEPQVREDGSELWLRTTKVPIKNEDGEIIGVFGSYEDISEIKLAEERQQALEVHLRQSQKMEALGTLAGGIAHDFNNILSAIMGYAELVREELPDGDARQQDLDQLLLASDRGKQLVQRILAFSRPEQNETVLVAFDRVLDDTIKLLRATLPSTIGLRAEIALCDGVIRGNESDIHQLVVNLATNAAYAMHDSTGAITIKLKMEDYGSPVRHHRGELQPGRYFHFIVEDTGPGIDPQYIDRIFDPFFTTKGVGKGTGLGLSVVFGIVTSLGGAINVESTVGEGTRFDMYFPHLEGSESQEPPELDEDSARGKERVLLVDDEPSLVDLGKRVLTRLGYTVTAFDRPGDALRAFLDAPDDFDVVVTDFTMPGTTGVELAREIRTRRPDIAIVLVTGYSDGVTRETVLAEGIRAFIMKPYRAEKLAHSIREALDQQ